MSSSRESYNLLKFPHKLFEVNSWKYDKKLIFGDTFGPLICLLRGHRIYTTDEFESEFNISPDFICGSVNIKHYWLACKSCHQFLTKENLTGRDKLIKHKEGHLP